MAQTLSRHASSQSSISTAVVSAVAEATGSEPESLEPLFSTLDPDALDALFESTQGGTERAPTQVTFTYAGCDVVVSGDGTVEASRTSRGGAT